MLYNARKYSNKMARIIYILLHGAWHANWCWKKIMPLLTKEGHKVLAPNLPGHGQDKTPFKDVCLQTYVYSVQKLVADQTSPVILVGHSMAGVVISQVAEEIPEKIHKLIYVAGFVPDYNGALVHEEGKTKTPSVTKEIEINESSNEISLKLSPRLRELFYNACSEEDARWALAQLQKQPLQPFINTVTLSNDKFGSVQKLYVECLKDQAIRIEDQRRMNSKLECEIVTLDTDHSPFLSRPNELVHILHNAAFENKAKRQLILPDDKQMKL